MNPDPIQVISAAIFALAVAHTFSTRLFERLAHLRPRHAGVWHLLGEVEAVFGLWAMALIAVMMLLAGRSAATEYLDSRNFTEPMFVFAIMVIAASRPILELAERGVSVLSMAIPASRPLSLYFVTLSLVPLLGSLITEPAAMTLAALLLRERFLSRGLSERVKYATLGVLFVNVSIGGTLTSFAAPPVLMVAAKWSGDTAFMMSAFGWKAALAVSLNALAATLIARRELSGLGDAGPAPRRTTPFPVITAHLFFLAAVVAFAHHPAAFMGMFLFFLGFASAYQRYQDRLILREGLMVAFFLAGLVVLGGQQRWWLEPLLHGMGESTVYFGATLLTAVTDNAALTYLGAQVDGLTPAFQYALVAGAVTGGGLTVIANAPNPSGHAILRGEFEGGAVRPLGLLIAAIPPTIVAVAAFRLF
jgi:hypothetical protein